MADDDRCSQDTGGSLVGGSSASIYGAVGRQRISVMLRCFRIGFVYDMVLSACAKAGRVGAVGLGRGSQSQPGCNGP